MGTKLADSEREALVREAKLQTKAIMRLGIWQRLAYSLLAVGILVGWWGFQSDGPDWSRPAGIILAAVFAVVSAVLYVGIRHAKQNVRNILSVAGVDIGSKEEASVRSVVGKKGSDSAQSATAPRKVSHRSLRSSK